MYFLLLLIFSNVLKIVLGLMEDPVIDLSHLGLLKGRTIETSWSHRTVYQFVDVKYAESPSGENRFKPPVPVQPWNGTRLVQSNGFGCPSVFALEEYKVLLKNKTIDIEDCLTMTITTPNITGNYPVLVFLHGEFLYEGNNLEGSPEYMLEKDIIMVVPQYRLGPLGFLSTKTEDVPGNVGVLDVVMALKWIKFFISNFGGDPNRITLMGQVGGAAIAHLLTISPIVEDELFHQVIYQSGSALMPVFLTEESERYAIEIGLKANCTYNSSHEDFNELNNCLRNLSVVDILDAFYEHVLENTGYGLGSSGGVQFTIGGPSPILPTHPLMFNNKNITKGYPTMGGTPRHVGSRILKYIFQSDFENSIPDDVMKGADYISHILYETQGFDDSGVLTTIIKDKLFTPEIIKNGTFIAMLPGLIDLSGMVVHKIPVLLALNRNSKLIPNQTFLYSFDYRGQYNRYPDFDEDFDVGTPFMSGVTLTDENIYLFPYPSHIEILNAIDKEMARKMVELWSSFVITGIPTTGENDFHWPSMESEENGPYLKIDHEFRIGGNYNDEFHSTLNDELEGNSLIRVDYRKHSTEDLLKKNSRKKSYWKRN